MVFEAKYPKNDDYKSHAKSYNPQDDRYQLISKTVRSVGDVNVLVGQNGMTTGLTMPMVVMIRVASNVFSVFDDVISQGVDKHAKFPNETALAIPPIGA